MKKYILVILAGLNIGLVYAWCNYSFFSFQPNIDQISQQISEDERNLPDKIVVILKKLDVLTTDAAANRRLLQRCKSLQGMSKAEIKLHEITWAFLIPVTLDDSEELSIYVHLMPFSEGEGLSYGARKYFSKEIDELTEEEVLKLLVISKSPAKYSSIEGNEELNEQAKKLKNSNISPFRQIRLFSKVSQKPSHN